MSHFHYDDYINFLQIITPDNIPDYMHQLQWSNMVEDCPIFDVLFEFCQLCALENMGGAARFMSPLERKVGMDPIVMEPISSGCSFAFMMTGILKYCSLIFLVLFVVALVCVDVMKK